MLSTSILPIFALSFTLANAVVISGGAAVENLERRYGWADFLNNGGMHSEL